MKCERCERDTPKEKRWLTVFMVLAMLMGMTVPAMAVDYTESVPCRYDYVSYFSEGLAAVQRDGKWGFIRIVVQMSDWAKEQVNRAAGAGLVPNGLGNDY